MMGVSTEGSITRPRNIPDHPHKHNNPSSDREAEILAFTVNKFSVMLERSYPLLGFLDINPKNCYSQNEYVCFETNNEQTAINDYIRNDMGHVNRVQQSFPVILPVRRICFK